MTAFEAYDRNIFHLESMGIQRGEKRSAYFCTPVGATILGWTGVDGIHYCFVRGFSDMVFAVSPMNTAGNYVHPVAKSFDDFIRLLLACFHDAAIEQCWQWSADAFEAYCKDNPASQEQKAAAMQISKITGLSPMEASFTYITELQKGFDYGKLRYSKDSEELDPPEPCVPSSPKWQVFYNGNFWGHRGQERAGKEITLDRTCRWCDEIVHIPAVYVCTEGVVIDICIEVDAGLVNAYIERYRELDENAICEEEREQIQTENPLNLNFCPTGMLNGLSIDPGSSCSTTWIPSFSEDVEDSNATRWILEHYHLDLQKAWILSRVKFSWPGKKKQKIENLSLTLTPHKISIPGGRFTLAVNEQVAIQHPITGVEYTITAEELSKEQMEERHFLGDNLEYPRCYTRMNYRIVPELSDAEFHIIDSRKSDPVRQIVLKTGGKKTMGAAAIGIIGGANGPAMLLRGDSEQEVKVRTAVSALHFEPVEQVCWKIMFHKMPREVVSIELIE